MLLAICCPKNPKSATAMCKGAKLAVLYTAGGKGRHSLPLLPITATVAYPIRSVFDLTGRKAAFVHSYVTQHRRFLDQCSIIKAVS